ncbi:MAG: zf-TFIIB domain-containing protein [Ilumatobacteraceae bacterium]
MKCPTCPDAVLVMADRAGIEIDYCPTCRGVWLDRGELDKIIERNAAATAPAPEPAAASRILPADQPQYQQPQYQQPQQPYRSNSKYHSKYHDPRGGYAKKKKSSFLGEIFEF